MDVSIIILSYNTCALLRDCLNSIYVKEHGYSYEIFVVDNASSDDSCVMVEKDFPKVHLLRNSKNLGFSKANNQAIRESKGKYILLLNSDTVLKNNAGGIMYEFMQAHSRAAVCGPLLLNADGTVQQSIDTHSTATSMLSRLILGGYRNRSLRFFQDKYRPGAFDYSKTTRIPDGWLTGACLMVRRSVFDQVGLLDERYVFAMEDADFGLSVMVGQNWTSF